MTHAQLFAGQLVFVITYLFLTIFSSWLIKELGTELLYKYTRRHRMFKDFLCAFVAVLLVTVCTHVSFGFAFYCMETAGLWTLF